MTNVKKVQSEKLSWPMTKYSWPVIQPRKYVNVAIRLWEASVASMSKYPAKWKYKVCIHPLSDDIDLGALLWLHYCWWLFIHYSAGIWHSGLLTDSVSLLFWLWSTLIQYLEVMMTFIHCKWYLLFPFYLYDIPLHSTFWADNDCTGMFFSSILISEWCHWWCICYLLFILMGLDGISSVHSMLGDMFIVHCICDRYDGSIDIVGGS